MEFELRSESCSPVFVGVYDIGGPIDSPWEPEVSNIVTLKLGKVGVVVKILAVATKTYTGQIISFENYDNDEYDECEGNKINDVVKFTYANIITCGRN